MTGLNSRREGGRRVSGANPSARRPVGPGRGPADRDEGGPTGTTGFLCGGGRGCGAYWSLHYAAAMVKVPTDGQCSASIPIRGVAA